jgi:hypothetical protein
MLSNRNERQILSVLHLQKVGLKALTVPVKCMSDFALEAGTRRAAKNAVRWNREHDRLSPQQSL